VAVEVLMNKIGPKVEKFIAFSWNEPFGKWTRYYFWTEESMNKFCSDNADLGPWTKFEMREILDGD
jgi:hypothetical protein